MLPITELLLTPGQGGRPGRLIVPKGLVIHYTGNEDTGANALANRDYFNNHPQDKVAAHYIVDDSNIIQCVPENEMAYHVGAKVYTKAALKWLSPYPNDCTIGIEMCINEGNNFEQTVQNTVELAADILLRRGWTVDELWRHYDVTLKNCPAYWVEDEAGWQDFKERVNAELSMGAGDKDRVIAVMDGRYFGGLLVDGITYVEARRFAEALGCKVSWDGAIRTVNITKEG